MNKIKITITAETETDMPLENELMDMISKSMAEGAESNTDSSIKVSKMKYNYEALLSGEGEISFGEDEQPVDGLGFES